MCFVSGAAFRSSWLGLFLVVCGLAGSSLYGQEPAGLPYNDSFYGDEFPGDNDELNYGHFGYDDWDADWNDEYEYPYSTTMATSGGNNDTWWQRSPYYNEDEWYDPTDWFDGNNYEYDPAYELDDASYDRDSSSLNDVEDNYYYYDYDDQYGDEVYDYGIQVGDEEGDDSYNYGYDYEYYNDPIP
ncbi:MAG TPA: hypothetical protein VF175_04585 [Lacipirellula sp.]